MARIDIPKTFKHVRIILALLLLIISVGCVNTTPQEEDVESVPGWRMPELAVTDLTTRPERPNPGDEITLSATVSNIGAGDTPRADLVFYVDNMKIRLVTIDSLLPNEEKRIEASWKATGSGKHLVRAELEIASADFDSSLSNNVHTAVVRVPGDSAPVPELEFAKIDSNNLKLAIGTSARIPLKVRNPGFIETPSVPVTFYIDRKRVSTGEIAHLAPGEVQEIDIPWSGVTPGEHLITLEMAPSDIFPDNDTPYVKTWYVAIPDRTTRYDVVAKDKWVSIGPRILDNGWVGRMNVLAFYPKNSRIMYAGGFGFDASIDAAPGVWKTENGGDSWSAIGDQLPSMLISAVVVDPKYPDIVYAASRGSINGGGEGIFKSTDGGQTWFEFVDPQLLKGIGELSGVRNLVIRYPGYPTPDTVLIYAGTFQGLLRYMSNNPWETRSATSDWEIIKTGSIRDIAIHPSNPAIIYVSVDSSGLFTTKYGTSQNITDADWSHLVNGLPAITPQSWFTLDLVERYPNVLYTGIANPKSGVYFGIYRSVNEGQTWNIVKEYTDSDLDGALYNPYIRVYVNSQSNPPAFIVYFGGVALYQYVENPTPQKGGVTARVYGVQSDLKRLEFDPENSGTYYSLGDQGIFRCKVQGASSNWVFDKNNNKRYAISADACVHRNTDLRVTEFYDFDVSRTRSNRIIGGTQDTGTLLFEGSPDWRLIKGGDGLYSLFDPNNDQVMYAQHQCLGGANPTRRKEDGKDWVPVQTNNLPTGCGYDSAYIAHDPNQSNVLVAVGNQVYSTNNGGQSWTGEGPQNATFFGPVTRVVIAPGTRFWIAGTQSGQIWIRYPQRRIAPPSDSTPVQQRPDWELLYQHQDGASVQSLAFAPTDSTVLYAIFRGGAAERRIWMFQLNPTPGFPWGTWAPKNITKNFPENLVPWVITGHPNDPLRAFVGTNKGVLSWSLLTDSQFPWQLYNDGLPLTSVVDLIAVPNQGLLFAATKGRGAWQVVTSP